MENGSLEADTKTRTLPRSQPMFLRQAARRKALMVTFYKNGDPFYSGAKVSINPGKDFHNIDSLCDHLTQRLKIAQGVRYIFSLDGVRVSSLDEIEDGGSYVASGSKGFRQAAYGQNNRIRSASKAPRRGVLAPTGLKDDNPRMIRPVGNKKPESHRSLPSKERQAVHLVSGSQSLPGSREGRIITVISNLDPAVRSRVLLNLRTTQNFEDILHDLGQSIKMRNVKIMMTPTGQMVKSFSQLKYDYADVDTFYLDSKGEEPMTKDTSRSTESLGATSKESSRFSAKLSRPGSAPNLEGMTAEWVESIHPSPLDHQRAYEVAASTNVAINSVNNNNNAAAATTSSSRSDYTYTSNTTLSTQRGSRLERKPELIWIHGYKGYGTTKNLHILQSGEILYTVAAVAILFNRRQHMQRFYLGHTEDIDSIAYHPNEDIAASGQGAGPTHSSQAHIRIWKVNSLSTLTVIGIGHVEDGVSCIAFSPEAWLLAVVDASPDHTISIWDWQKNALLGKAVTHRNNVLGCHFHPNEDDLLVTYGLQHLCFWRRGKDGFLDRLDAISNEHAPKNITCVEFFSDGSFVTGNDNGYITVWSSSSDGSCFYISKEMKAHENDISVLLFLPRNILISASSLDREDQIKAWDTEKKFQKIASSSLPRGTGGIHALIQQRLNSADGHFFVGTTHNLILEGTLHGKFRPVIQSHCRDAQAIAASPNDYSFFTVGRDRAVCKWDIGNLLWMAPVESECLSVAVHPYGTVVSVGTISGKMTTFAADSAMEIATVTVANSALNVLAYSPDGSLLAAGAHDGYIYIVIVQNQGYVHKKGDVIKGQEPVISLDWSSDSRVLQTVTSDGQYQELICWDIHVQKPRSPTMKSLDWNSLTCTLNPEIVAIWDNDHLMDVVNLTCHRSSNRHMLAVGDRTGYLRLFKFPCTDPKERFTEQKCSSLGVTSVRFLYGDKYLVTFLGSCGNFLIWKMVSKPWNS